MRAHAFTRFAQSCILDMGGASGPPTINVEGYDDTSTLLGCAQIQLAPAETRALYLPIVRKP